MKRWIALSPLAAAILGLTACGGGGGDATTTATTYSVTGTVPGTKIEAFCNDGSYYQTFSQQNGTNQHPFTLNLPAGVDCQLVMTTNENDATKTIITPLTFNGNNAFRGLAAGATFNLGYVPLSLDYAAIDDQDDDHVKDSPLDHVPQTVSGVELKKAALLIDPDEDGIPNIYDPDDDEDGKRDEVDPDDDDDGILDVNEKDSDGDGVPDVDDRDDDNDGIEDIRDGDYTAPLNTVRIERPINWQLPSSYTPDSTGGRLLVSQCAQCHGTNGYSVSTIDGLVGEAAELREEMIEMYFKPNIHIMNAQAKGYSTNEVSSMSTYLLSIRNTYGAGFNNGDDDYDDDAYERDDD